MVSTRSDSPSRPPGPRDRFGIIRRLQRQFGSATQPRHGRAQVVRDVVQRLAHPADERLVLFEHPIEQVDQFIKFIARFARRNPCVHLARFKDRADRLDQLADRR